MGKKRKNQQKKSEPIKKSYNIWAWVILAIIIWIALFLRLGFASTASKIPFNFLSDSSQYFSWAKKIIAGTEFIDVYHQAPLYPFFLALIFSLFGTSIHYALIVQGILGAISCFLVFYLSMKIFKNIWMGVASAFVMSVYAPAIFYNGMLLMATLVTFLDLGFLILLLKALEDNKKWMWALTGICFGVSALARGTILLFIPFLIIFFIVKLWYESGQDREDSEKAKFPCLMDRFIYPVFIFLLGAFLVISPVTLRNYIKGKDLVLIAANAGITFYEGNNPWANGQYMDPPGLDLAEDFNGGKIAGNYEKRTLQPSEISKFWFRESGRFIKEKPFAYLTLLIWKFLYFWNRYEIPNAENIYFAKQYSKILQLPLFSFLLVGALGLWGMIMAIVKKIPNAFILFLFLFSHMISTVLFFITARYRLPITPILIVFMFYPIFILKDKIWNKTHSNGLLWIGIGILIFIFVAFPWKGLNPNHDYASSYGNIGILFHRTGNPHKAIRYFEMAIDYDPTYIKSYNNIGGLYYVIGEQDKAFEYWKKGLELDPNFPLIHQNLASVYLGQEKIKEALEAFSIAAPRLPYSVKLKEMEDKFKFSSF